MHADPKVRRSNPQACEVARLSHESKTVHKQRTDPHHRRYPNLSVESACCASNNQQDQRGLRGDRILVVPLSNGDVTGDDKQQTDTERFAGSEGGCIEPTPMPCIEGEPVEQFHRNDNPCDAQKAHARFGDPSFSEKETK